jgi:tetratricopeptide (TPR) repeat protein
MRSVLKGILYLALFAACYFCGFNAYRDYTLLMNDDAEDLGRSSRRKKPTATTGTNAPTDLVASNALPVLTNAAAATNITTTRPALNNPAAGEGSEDPVQGRSGRRVARLYVHLLGYSVGFAVAMLGLGYLVAQDFGHLLNFRLGKEVSYVSDRSARKAAYERAENAILKGQHQEAIRLLQGILKKHPEHTHSLLRIAEVYDKELQDYSNAAVHYEKLLELELPAEQWGWLAIRLSNIYSGKLNQPQAALALIRRIATDYPQTQAGGKALKRLAALAASGLDPGADE